MTAVETTRAHLKYVISNKGHLRLFAVVSIVWMAITTWLLWLPLPGAQMDDSNSIMGSRVAACANFVLSLDYDPCAARENFFAAIVTVMLRAGVVLFVPVILPLLVLLGLLIFEWIKEGYSEQPSG
jgi:hypothetical protein